MITDAEVLKIMAHFTDAQTVLVNESLEPELCPALSQMPKNFSGPCLQVTEGRSQCWTWE